MAAKGKTRLLALAITIIAAPALFASIPRNEALPPPTLDLTHKDAANFSLDKRSYPYELAAAGGSNLLSSSHRPPRVSFTFTSTCINAFADVAGIAAPRPDAVIELDKRITAKLEILRVKEKHASGVFAFAYEANIKRPRYLSWKMQRALVVQALPLFDPFSGMSYARARWLNHEIGQFVSPDPLSYQDSSNLYSFAAGDPVNGRDATGEATAQGDVEASRRFAAAMESQRKAELAKYQASLGPTGFVMTTRDTNSFAGGFWYIVDSLTGGVFSSKHANYKPLNAEEGTDAASDMQAFQRQHPGTAFVVDSAGALLPQSKPVKVALFAGAVLQYIDRKASSQPAPQPSSPGVVRAQSGIGKLPTGPGPAVVSSLVSPRAGAVQQALTAAEKDLLRAEARDLWQAVTGRRAIWDGLQVHHRVPLEWHHLFQSDPNRMANLVGVTSADHSEISTAWAAWKRSLNGRVPSAAEVLEKAIRIDEEFGEIMKFVK